jgi:quercetin dioxygenase-like cupin family protein
MRKVWLSQKRNLINNEKIKETLLMRTKSGKRDFLFTLVALAIIPTLSFAAEEKNSPEEKISSPTVAQQLFKKAQANDDWKFAFLTGKYAQVVFMNISPNTSPKNEIGEEKHPFDQIIFIVEGNGKAVLNKKPSTIKEGDMIFIPQGTSHNVINTNEKEELKLISIYSDIDIPAEATYKKKEDEIDELGE